MENLTRRGAFKLLGVALLSPAALVVNEAEAQWGSAAAPLGAAPRLAPLLGVLVASDPVGAAPRLRLALNPAP
ncbi:MAG TPA: hypothetical protein VMU18_09960 [Rhodoblastus sp.]|nr:hypothetical protein [Rhodoblastus sp.]